MRNRPVEFEGQLRAGHEIVVDVEFLSKLDFVVSLSDFSCETVEFRSEICILCRN